ncbi:hypothetical protein BUZ00_08035 [Staphylococcus gallinarum]|nr:hypothetical protein BUZ00_08035 [Staphylococcus gallinarum]RIO82915.1 hypothetical protein BUZ10_11770 [Staphylococcus gallinarum]
MKYSKVCQEREIVSIIQLWRTFGLLKQEIFYGERFDHFYQLEHAIQNYINF